MYIILDDNGVYHGNFVKLKQAILTAIDLSDGGHGYEYNVYKLPNDERAIYNTYNKRVIRNERSRLRFRAIDHVNFILERMKSYDGERRTVAHLACQDLINKWSITSKELG